MKKQSYSFWNLVTINVGSMIGVGIFFKNPGILRTTGNIYIALISWIVGAVLIYGMSLSFAEAQSYTGKNNISGTVPNWVTAFIGPKTGRIAHQLFGWLYNPIFASLLCYYAVYFALTGMGWTGTDIETKWKLVYALTTLVYIALTAGNAFSYSFGKVLQMAGTIIKFIPLLAVLVLGFANPIETSATNTFSKATTWNWGTIFAALPAVFFAFDGFINGVTLSKEEEKKGDATRSLLFSVISVTIFYVAFAASVGWGTSDAGLFDLFAKTFGNTGSTAIYFLIAISAYTVANGQQITSSRTIKAMADAKATIPLKVLAKVEADGRHAGQTWVNFWIGMFFMTLMFLVAEVTGDSKELTFDNFGNAITLFGFAFYALVTFGTFANRFSSKLKVDKQKGFAFQFASAFIVFWIVIQNTVNYFIKAVKFAVKDGQHALKTEPTVMWLVVLTIVILFVTTKVSELANKEMS